MTLPDVGRRPAVVLVVTVALWIRVALRVAATALPFVDRTGDYDLTRLALVIGVNGFDLFALVGHPTLSDPA